LIYAFDEYELDTRCYELRRGDTRIPLEPQVFDVLSLLIECRDRVVGKDEILQRVWADRFISESTLASRLTAARKAVDDTAKQQRRIKTIHGRGYRFVGQVAERADPAEIRPPTEPEEPALDESADAPLRDLDRATQLDRLHERLGAATGGARQIVFVTGEAGLGKTTLVEAFLREATHREGVWTVTGQCLEHSGAGEAYMAVLEAVGRQCRQPGGQELV